MTTLTKSASIEEQAESYMTLLRFIYNFNPVVFEMAWDPATEKNMHDHFVSKWQSFCQSEGFASANAFMRFVGALSNDNGRRFTEAIARYNEQKNY